MSKESMPPYGAAESTSNDSTPADRLRALLQRADLSQRGAAQLLGIDERTMRMWCAGQGVPPESVFRALTPRLTYSEHLRYRIEMNEPVIEVLESGRLHELPRSYRPVSEELAKKEAAHLRDRNEKYRAFLRVDEAFYRRQDAHSEVILQWLTSGFGASLESLAALDAADQEFQSAKAEGDRITATIAAINPLYRQKRME